MGHRVVTVDLPSDDPAATFESYAEVVVKAMSEEDKRAVLVGHSLAGLTIPLVAARRPVGRLVYLCALVPIPGRSFSEQLGIESDALSTEYLAGIEADESGSGRWIDEELAREILYADCDESHARAAIKRLRPQARTPYGVPCPLDEIGTEKSTYISCSEDRLVSPAWSHRTATGLLNARLIELEGSHSPFLSRPKELATALHEESVRG